MTPDQIELAKSMAGTMPRENIAEALGVSLVNLKRSCRGVSFYYFQTYAANMDLVKEVCAYYEKHGRVKTQEQYPHLKIRSIVERYKFFEPRCLPWTENEKIELVKFAGLATKANQAKFFNRPRANKGSIVSAWIKIFKVSPRQLHGLPRYKAKLFAKPGCPYIKTEHGFIYLWSDLENYLAADCPEFIVTAVKAMAEFQRKILGENPHVEAVNIQQALESA